MEGRLICDWRVDVVDCADFHGSVYCCALRYTLHMILLYLHVTGHITTE